jgi:hypothetical protein
VEEVSINGLVFGRENSNPNLRGGIIQATGDPRPFTIKYVGNANSSAVALARLNGARENPRMAIEYRALPAWF